MNDLNKLKLIDDTINSMDGQLRATPSPYLMARISSRLAIGEGQTSVWDRIIGFITKPSIAVIGMVIIALMNFYIIREKAAETEDTTSIDIYLDGSAVAATSGINYNWNP